MAGVLGVICPTSKGKICPSGCFAAPTAQQDDPARCNGQYGLVRHERVRREALVNETD
jgi:hypothetical protein